MKKRTIYIGLFLIFIIGVISLIGTFATDSTITEGNSSKADYLFNINLEEKLNNEVVIPSYDSKIIDIKISNPNDFDMSYLLYLEGINSNISIINIGDTEASEVLSSKSTNIVKVFIQNNSSSNATITIKSITGFEKETLSLPSNSTAINKGIYYKSIVKPSDNTQGKIKPSIKLSTQGGSVKYTISPNDGYKYKSTTCEGTVVDNVLTISNITSNVNCEVLFEPITIQVKLDPAGGTLETSYTDVTQHTYTIPYTATYKLETWGAQGGNTSTNIGGYGGYSVGEVPLNKGDVIYIYVGGQGKSNSGLNGGAGGYNGGGKGGTTATNYSTGGGSGGGGATHMALQSGLLSTLSNSKDKILIVSGGGGGSMSWELSTKKFKGGNAGGFEGGLGARYSGTYTAANQTSGNAFGQGFNCNTKLAQLGGMMDNGGGGGGYYGGLSLKSNPNSNAAGCGGSSYIGYSGLKNGVMYCYECTESTTAGIYTVNTVGTSSMADKTNCPDGYSANPVSKCAKSGNGAAKISLTIDESYSLSYNEKYSFLMTLKKSGYVFDGWYTGKNGTGTKITTDTPVSIAKDHTLYAYWVKPNVPSFTYTGTYQVVDNDDNEISDPTTYAGEWKIRFLSSGTLTFNDNIEIENGIDIFVVGGGGNGASGSSYIAQDSRGGGGGGGGAALTITKFPAVAGSSYSIVVGSNKANSSFGLDGTAYFTALAGKTPATPSYSSNTGLYGPIGSGGAGRLTSETSDYGATSVIAKAGGSGNGSAGNYEFNEEGNKRYGAGGGKGSDGVSTAVSGTAAAGGTGGTNGGGKGGQGCSYVDKGSGYSPYGGYSGSAATANTGSGGGGGGSACGTSSTTYGNIGSGGAGGSGIVIIRNTR